jgi:hypothetical protein
MPCPNFCPYSCHGHIPARAPQDCISSDSDTSSRDLNIGDSSIGVSSDARVIRIVKILRILRIARILKLVKFVT